TSKLFSDTLSYRIPEISQQNFIGELEHKSMMPTILMGLSHSKNVNTNVIICQIRVDYIISDVILFRATYETVRQVPIQKDCIITIRITPSDIPQD
ncbi:MAG: hypothetical protein EZS28_054490, partial [Streblomastix strix]